MRRLAPLLLLALLSTAPADAAKPSGPSLVRCEAYAEGGPNKLRVVGYGVDSPDAKRDALRVGRFLAEQQLAVDLWPWLLSDHPASRRVAEPRLTGVLADDPLRVPGFGWKIGSCSGVTLPKGKAFAASVGEVTVERASPGAAVSAARRHGCVGPWAAGLSRGLLDLVAASGSERGETLHTLLQSNVDRLSVCLQGDPKLAPGKAKATKAPKSGQVECRRRALDPAGLGGIGWGPDPEVASENAAWAALLAEGRALLSRGVKAWPESPGQRSTAVSDALERLTVILPPGAALERGLTTCTVVDSKPELAFRPRGELEKKECKVTAADKDADVETVRDGMCQAELRRGARASRDSVLRASAGRAQDDLRFSGWETLLRCDAYCIDATTAGGTVSIELTGVPDRSSQKKSISLLSKAVKAQDVETAALVMPSIAEPPAIRKRERRSDQYWSELAAQVAAPDSAGFQAAFQWVQVEGAWLLLATGG
jgi:hypothetical protein